MAEPSSTVTVQQRSTTMNPAILFYVLASGVLITLIFYFGAKVFVPFMIALVIWHILNAICNWLSQKTGMSKKYAMSFSVVAIVSLLVMAIGNINDNVQEIAKSAPVYKERLEAISKQVLEHPKIKGRVTLEMINNHLNVSSTVSKAAKGVKAVTGWLSVFFVVVLYVIFMFDGQRHFDEINRALFPQGDEHQESKKMLEEIGAKVQQYLNMKLLVSTLTGLLSWGLLAFIGVDFAGFWAVLIFLLNFIPVIGSLIAVLFPITISLIQFNFTWPFFLTAGGLIVIQLAMGNYLEPKLMGNSLNLNGIAIMVSLSYWGTVWGIPGMFFSIPLTVIAMIILARFPRTRWISICCSQSGQVAFDEAQKATA